MNVGILVFSKPNQDLFSGSSRLVEAAQQAGHAAVKLYEPFFSFGQAADGPFIRYESRPLDAFDAVIVRPNFVEEPGLHAHTIDALAQAGIRLVGGGPGVRQTKNKLTQHTILQQAGIPMPHWTIVRESEQAENAAEALGFPVVIKVPFGTHGKGVFFAPDAASFMPIVDYLSVRDGNPMIVQEFIAEAGCADIRVFVVGGHIVAAMERVARPGDVRSNASIGGTGRPVVLSEAEKRLALETTRVFGLDIAGVDLLRSNRGPLVIEINANPGFKELEAATGVDVAGAIVEFAIERSSWRGGVLDGEATPHEIASVGNLPRNDGPYA